MHLLFSEKLVAQCLKAKTRSLPAGLLAVALISSSLPINYFLYNLRIAQISIEQLFIHSHVLIEATIIFHLPLFNA